eukprot:TRINITY_DN3328_c0_g1_i1.p1 TRINITY_DN3328_c0_g1~~TRINITY_DN3328_c0_g1_i1.p1  ORF type:complete len:288 (+),score=46.17 TRINITY_DN3328_c0_g1_i1:87-950(+)
MDSKQITENVINSTGHGGLQRIQIKHKEGSSAEVYLNGAHITSFKNSKGEELIFMSTKAVFKEGKAIRGGIPLCWPQFGPGELPQHGFARTSLWELEDATVDNIAVTVVLGLSDSQETRSAWNHEFKLQYRISLFKDKLSLELTALNTSGEPIRFSTALHTYFKVSDARSARIHGMKGLHYVDKVAQGQKKEEKDDEVTFTGETDRVYLGAPDEIHIRDGNSTTLLRKSGFEDVVVWNPWIQKCKEMADMGDDDWPHMVCAEAAQVGNPIILAPGRSWTGKQELSKL